jgi:hypothetical protein
LEWLRNYARNKVPLVLVSVPSLYLVISRYICFIGNTSPSRILEIW